MTTFSNRIERGGKAFSGLPTSLKWTILPAMMIIVVAIVLFSGYANITVWQKSAPEWAVPIMTVIGAVSELWGAIGLLVIWRLASRKAFIAAAAALCLWLPPVTLNGYSNYLFLTGLNFDISAGNTVDTLEGTIAQDSIDEAKLEYDAIGVTRTPEAIQRELDNTPGNYRTKRGQLEAELEQANRRAVLETRLEEGRTNVLEAAQASAEAKPSILANEKVILGFVLWTEFFKLIGFWLMRAFAEPAPATVNEKSARKQKKAKQARAAITAQNVHVLEQPTLKEIEHEAETEAPRKKQIPVL